VQQWIANRIELESIIEQMKEVSQDAFEVASLLMREETEDFQPKKPENNYPSKVGFRVRKI
jgi:hypothetical protein